MTQRGAYYNEFDPFAAAWLRNLISAGHLPPGDVDERSIVDVRPDDLTGYVQCHFFAGIGGWGHALRLSGWPDDRPIWTGSCPCQPFSNAGKGGGTDDPRHLWPDFLRLIAAGRPPVVMGEQVAGSAGYGWFDGVRADLAGEGYASRGVDIPACAVDAPHIRNRLYWVAVANAAEERASPQHAWRAGDHLRRDTGQGGGSHGREPLADAQGVERGAGLRRAGAQRDGLEPSDGHGRDESLADADHRGCDGRPEDAERGAVERAVAERADARVGQLWGHAEGDGRREGGSQHELWCGRPAVAGPDAPGGQLLGFSNSFDRRAGGGQEQGRRGNGSEALDADAQRTIRGVAQGDADSSGLAVGSQPEDRRGNVREEGASTVEADHGRGGPRHMADPHELIGRLGDEQPAGQLSGAEQDPGNDLRAGSRNEPATFWSSSDRLLCHDGKTRRTQPGVPLLVNGVRGRVAFGLAAGQPGHAEADRPLNRIGVWRGAGNAIVPQEAEQVIRAYMDVAR